MPKPLAEVPRERWPQHIAIIMDGNGRWARRQGMPRIEAIARRKVRSPHLREARRLGLKQLTLYASQARTGSAPPMK